MPYTPQQWHDETTSAPYGPISAARLTVIENGISSANSIVYNLADYGAAGDGITDDTAAVQAAISAAQATSGLVYSKPGKTYLVNNAFALSANGLVIDMGGSKIKKKSTFPNLFTASGAVFNVTASNVTIRNLAIDGNRAAGAGGSGIWSDGTGTRLDRVVCQNTSWNGLICDSGTLDAVQCEGSAAGQNGFACFSGVLRTYDCYAASNDNAGLFFGTSASAGCRLEARTYQNNLAGAQILCNNGHCPYFLCDSSSQFGLILGPSSTVSGWTFDYVETNNTGVAIPGHAENDTGPGIEIFGANHCTFGTVVSKANLGYGLAIAKNDANIGSSYNTFHTVTCDQTGAVNGDPGVDITGGSTFNDFSHVTVIGHTVAINIGEGTTGNNDNSFGPVTLFNNGFGGITIDGGLRNTFASVVSRNTFSADIHTIESKGVVSFISANAQFNTIGFLDHKDTGTDMTTVPAALVWADSAAVNNVVRDGYARDSQVGAQDGNGGNYFYLRRPTRRTVLSTFDSGETWSNSANNTTNGQFVEGNGGKKVTGGTNAYTTSTRTVSLNLSAMADSDFFRLWVYITNQADMLAGGTGIAMQMNSAGGTYFLTGWQAVILKNGGQWLQARKGGAATVGTPSWAAITSIDLLVYGTAATATATFDNLHIAELQWDRNPTIGQNNTVASVTVAASPFLYQNTDNCPLNVMVSGGTVTAIDYSPDGSTFFPQGSTSGVFTLNPGDYTRVTYSVTPTMSKVPIR